jgi:hypothetical protein
MASVEEKLRDRDYDTKLPYPDRSAMSTEEFRKKREEWDADEYRLTLEFRTELAAETGLTGNPKEQILWDLVWEHGHASGLHDVYNYYLDFARLVV